ncbi:MAG: tripartite tricarboxylate transporter substrate binding protein [Devosiaceae bacterium]|nr:tripartite tricarboxylate transporter substrate binding protein [Devosiaceae bacterium]
MASERRTREICNKIGSNNVNKSYIKKAVTLAVVLTLTASSAFADAWPDRRVDLVIPFPAGGGLDQTLIPFAKMLEDELGQRVVIVNRPGAGGELGWEYVNGLADSSHTIVGFILPHLANTLLFSSPSYTVDSFKALGQLAEQENLWFARKDAPWDNLTELLEDAKSRPGEITVGVPGTGGDSYISTILTEQAANVDFRQVAFQGGNEVVAAVAGGHVDFGVERPGDLATLADEFKVLGALADRRNPNWPDAATFTEQVPELNIPSFTLVRALGVTTAFKEQNPEGFQILADAVRRVTLSEEFAAEMAKIDVEVTYAGPEELQVRFDNGYEYMSQFVDLIRAEREALK